MITITAKIDLLSGFNRDLSLGSTNLSGNNISSDLGNIVGFKKIARNPFIIGASKIGDGSILSGKLDYFIDSQLSDDNGNFTNPYSLVIENTNSEEDKNKITSLTIAFDTLNNRHPKKILIDGVEYIDDDPVFTIANLSSVNSHTIEIFDWNTPKYPLVITGIYTEVSIDIDYRNLKSIDRSIFDRSDLKLPSFGIISNTGNIEFNDLDGEIRDYAEQQILKSGLKCQIWLENTLFDEAKENIGLFETDQWNYENDSKSVSVSLKDDLEEWQDINVGEISYDSRNPVSKPFSWLYEHLWALTSNRYYSEKNTYGKGNYNMLALDELDIETQDVLNNTYIQYPLLESGSLWQQWTKLCQVCQLHIYKNNNGVIVCRYNGGN